MNYKISIIIWIVILPYGIFGANEDPLTYENFLNNKLQFCTNSEAPWIKDYGGIKTIVPQSTEIEFPKLDQQSIKKSISSSSTISPENSEKLTKEILKTDTSNFKLFNIVKIYHREKMNKAFASSIILARLQVLRNLQGTLAKSLWSNISEIGKKLEQERKKLDQLLELNGGKNDESSRSVGSDQDRMIQTLMIEHCTYEQYLTYLRSNIQSDNATIIELERAIRIDSSNPNITIPQSISEFQQWVTSRITAIDQEIIRSRLVLKKSIYAFKGMERSYGAHLLLIYIYDDYVRLRNNLLTYFNANTQYFQKSYNAQSTNR
jgi:hypothetical protein